MVFPQADILWQCEMDRYCQRILHKHWPTAIIYNDVRNIDTTTLSDIDLLLCGFPCQDLSIANNTKQTGNINGNKSGLWWEAHRIIKAKRPKYLMLENVWPFSNRLPRSGMMRGGIVYERQTWAHHTSESDGSSLPLLPTPTVNESKNTPCGKAQWKRNNSLNVEAAKMCGHTLQTIGTKARLNPRYVAWMMGYPTGYLD
jgi:hypothetical protein